MLLRNACYAPFLQTLQNYAQYFCKSFPFYCPCVTRGLQACILESESHSQRRIVYPYREFYVRSSIFEQGQNSWSCSLGSLGMSCFKRETSPILTVFKTRRQTDDPDPYASPSSRRRCCVSAVSTTNRPRMPSMYITSGLDHKILCPLSLIFNSLEGSHAKNSTPAPKVQELRRLICTFYVFTSWTSRTSKEFGFRYCEPSRACC